MSQSQALDEDGVERYVQECTLFFLNKHAENVPIKRTQVTGIVLREANRRTVNEVLKRTKENLKQVHGLNTVELNENPKSFMLVNIVKPLDEFVMGWSLEEKKKQTLLFLVLSVIFMNNGSITEGGLQTFLRKCDIIDEDCPISDFFGDVMQIIKKDFVTQRYIKYELARDMNDDEDAVHILRWGPRAEHEVKKKDILKSVCNIYGCAVEEFPEQLETTTT